MTSNDYYYLILHDKDIQEDGTLKKPHYHIVFNLQAKHSKAKFLEAIANAIGQHTDSISIDELIQLEGAVRYLIHIDNPEKHQYNEFEIVSNDKRLRRFIVGEEMWIVECMNESGTIKEFVNLVGLTLGNKYRGIAKDYMQDLEPASKHELKILREHDYYIKSILKRDDITAETKIDYINKIFDDFR